MLAKVVYSSSVQVYEADGFKVFHNAIGERCEEGGEPIKTYILETYYQHGESDNIAVDVQKGEPEVFIYLMNNEGRTVDRFTLTFSAVIH